MYESRTLLMHRDILFIIEIGLYQFSHFVHVSCMLTCAYLNIVCMHPYFAFLISLFIHSFPNWYLFLFFLIPLSFMTKTRRNFWISVHMHRRRYIDRGDTEILTHCCFLLICFFFFFGLMLWFIFQYLDTMCLYTVLTYSIPKSLLKFLGKLTQKILIFLVQLGCFVCTCIRLNTLFFTIFKYQ